MEAVAKQTNYLLFDLMLAFNVRRGVTIPLSAAKFYTGRKLEVFRLEAVRALHKKVWGERDHEVIFNVADNIPENVPQEEPELLMWYDQALARTEGD